jgi:hypothetical protein
MRWSDDYITFGPEDHPVTELSERNLPLIVKIPIGWHKVAKTLIDSGASLNLIMRKTFIEMGLKLSDLTPVHNTFHRIIPGQASTPIGCIDLKVFCRTGRTHVERCWRSRLPVSTSGTTVSLGGISS